MSACEMAEGVVFLFRKIVIDPMTTSRRLGDDVDWGAGVEMSKCGK